MYGRRSGGKRLRMDESQQGQEQQQYYGENDSNTSGDAQEEAFDPIGKWNFTQAFREGLVSFPLKIGHRFDKFFFIQKFANLKLQ